MPLLPASLFGAPTAVDDTPPTREQVAKAMALPVLQGATDEKPTHTLASLVEGNARTIVVFIRHHHCGMCVKYVQALSAHPALRATSEDKNSNIKLLVIGHGSHVGIEHYREISSAAFNMYVDETKQLYGALGLTRRYLGKAKDGMPNYMAGESVPSVVFKSIKEMVASGTLFWKGGDFSLLGGEFVFEQDGTCSFAHRMRDTSDHAEADELAKYVEGPPPSQS